MELKFAQAQKFANPLQKMRIYESGTQLKDNGRMIIPCTIMEIMETFSYQIPSSPLEDGTIIQDQIYRMPQSLNVSVFVYTENRDDFENSVKKAQISKQGFLILGKDGQRYDNYYLTDGSVAQTTEMEGGYIYNLSFEEVVFVKALASKVPLKQPKRKASAKMQNKGEQEVKRSSAKDIKLGIQAGIKNLF